jgi:hypothetical protein
MFNVRHAAVGQRVGHEVHRPAFTGPTRRRQRDALAARHAFPVSTTDLQAGVAIHPTHALVIRDDALADHEPYRGRTAAWACRRASNS